MGRIPRTFLATGLNLVVLGCFALAMWWIGAGSVLVKIGGWTVAVGAALTLSGLYFRWQGWE